MLIGTRKSNYLKRKVTSLNFRDAENGHAYEPVKLMVTIVDRGKGEKITKLYWQYGITFHLICLGRGTADLNLLSYLGLGETEKDVVLSVITESRVPNIMQVLLKEMNFDVPGNGIAFTIPIGSVDGSAALKFISNIVQGKEV